MDTLPSSKSIADFTGRVWHSDALDLLAALPDKSADMILVDLPYGVTACEWDIVIPFEPMWQGIRRVAKQKAAVVMTATEPFASKLRMSNEKWYRYDWVWAKKYVTSPQTAKYRPLPRHENILIFGNESPNYYPVKIQKSLDEIKRSSYNSYAGKKRGVYGSNPDRLSSRSNQEKSPSSIINENDDKSRTSTMHPTQKPVALFEYLIKTYTQKGETVLDFCSGSATTAIACLNLDRRYICGDSHLPYVEMSRQRIASHDPFQNTPLKTGEKQLSLFSNKE